MKFSVITPSYNSAASLEQAIESVLAQDYRDFEHIIVDGGSTDHTLEILKRYPHLRWVSEPDRGQVHAMNKGFAMSTGEVISYLNADDYYLKGAFAAVVPHFKRKARAVIGQVLVRTELPDGVKEWLCDPRVDFPSVLRHWEPNAYCVNPVGYFYRREVQEKISYREATGAKHDLEFLMELALHFQAVKIDRPLGVFNHALQTQTGLEQLRPGYWREENFPFVERLAAHLPPEEMEKFRLERQRGYQMRRHKTAREALALGMEKELVAAGELFLLPEDEDECAASRCGFVEHDRLGTPGDWVIPVFISGKVASKSICATLKMLSPEVLPAQVYHVHQMNPETISRSLPTFLPNRSHAAVGLSLKHLYDRYNERLHWKFITGVREPVSAALSGVFENWPAVEEKDIPRRLNIVLKYHLDHFITQYQKGVGIDVYKYPFDHEKKYAIIEQDNKSVLLYRMEELPQIFSRAMEDYLGVRDVRLAQVNVGEDKAYAARYREAKKKVRFDRSYLEKIYDTQYVRHFYSETEIDSFLERWSKKTVLVASAAPAPPPRPVDYLLFFVQRSGIKVLLELFQRAGVFGNPQQWLQEEKISALGQKEPAAGAEQTSPGANLSAEKEALRKNTAAAQKTAAQYLRPLIDQKRKKNGLFGMQVARHQLHLFSGECSLFKILRDDFKTIFLRRENILEQALQLYRAEMAETNEVEATDRAASGLALSRAEDASKAATAGGAKGAGVSTPSPQILESDIFDRVLQKVVNEELKIIGIMAAHKIAPLIVTTEEMSTDALTLLKRAALFLGVSFPEEVSLPVAALKKMALGEEDRALLRECAARHGDSIDRALSRLEEAYRRWEEATGLDFGLSRTGTSLQVKGVRRD